MKQVSQVLRAAMVDAEKRDVSLYRIAKACDLDDSIVYRFYHDECGLALTSVDRLCQFLGLELKVSDAPAPAFANSARRKASPAKAVVKKKTTAKKTAKKKKKATTSKVAKPAKKKKKSGKK